MVSCRVTVNVMDWVRAMVSVRYLIRYYVWECSIWLWVIIVLVQYSLDKECSWYWKAIWAPVMPPPPPQEKQVVSLSNSPGDQMWRVQAGAEDHSKIQNSPRHSRLSMHRDQVQLHRLHCCRTGTPGQNRIIKLTAHRLEWLSPDFKSNCKPTECRKDWHKW